jgi:hypothetical protein
LSLKPVRPLYSLGRALQQCCTSTYLQQNSPCVICWFLRCKHSRLIFNLGFGVKSQEVGVGGDPHHGSWVSSPRKPALNPPLPSSQDCEAGRSPLPSCAEGVSSFSPAPALTFAVGVRQKHRSAGISLAAAPCSAGRHPPGLSPSGLRERVSAATQGSARRRGVGLENRSRG